MASRSKVSRLPAEARAFIEAQLAEGRLSLGKLVDELQRRFPDELAEGTLPSKTALLRWQKKMAPRLAAIKATNDAAHLIAQRVGGSAEERTEALIAIVQGELYQAILALAGAEEVNPEARLQHLVAAARNIAQLSRTSIDLKEARAAEGKEDGARANKVLPAVLKRVLEAAYDL